MVTVTIVEVVVHKVHNPLLTHVIAYWNRWAFACTGGLCGHAHMQSHMLDIKSKALAKLCFIFLVYI